MPTQNKLYKHCTTSIVLAFFFFMANMAFAEMMTFQREYTYQASEADSLLSSRYIAIEQVKTLLLEELGTYLESETEVKNLQLTKDKIVTYTGGILNLQILEQDWNGKRYYLKAKISADPKDVAIYIANMHRERQKIKELEEARKKTDEALKEIERLKKELGKFAGYLGIVGMYQKEMEDFTKAIEREPKSAKDYNERGVAYASRGDNQQAIKHYDKAIERDHKYAEAYYNRGAAYLNLGNNHQAIRDFDKAIELDPKFELAYNDRGVAYFNLGDNRRAIRDFDKAIELHPEYAITYYNRGAAYGNLGDGWQAMKDIKTAARLGNKMAQEFLRSRGVSW